MKANMEENPGARERARNILAGCIVGGIILIIGPSIIFYILDYHSVTSDAGTIYYYKGTADVHDGMSDAEIQQALGNRIISAEMWGIYTRIRTAAVTIGAVIMGVGGTLGGLMYYCEGTRCPARQRW